MDPLSDVVGLLRPHAVVIKHISGCDTWGVRFADYDAPTFCIVLTGSCWLEYETDPTLRLELRAGDFLFVRNSEPFKMSSELGVICDGDPFSDGDLHYGPTDSEPSFRMLGGSFSIGQHNTTSLTELLPAKLHIRALESDTTELASIMTLITKEYFGDRPGRGAVLRRLLEVLLIESLRWHDLGQGAAPAGLLAGLHDRRIARTLRAMHSEVSEAWTVAKLARFAGMSRSAYAKRFSEVVGCSPMEYLFGWRMCLARDSLSKGSQSLDSIARSIGYQSAAAFSNAFRRRNGCPPSTFSRLRPLNSVQD